MAVWCRTSKSDRESVADTHTVMRRFLEDMAAMADFLAGIDIGTTGSKGMVFDTAGNALASAYIEYPCTYPKPGWVEQDPEDWWKATVETVRSVMEKGSLNPEDVKAIGLSGQMHGNIVPGRHLIRDTIPVGRNIAVRPADRQPHRHRLGQEQGQERRRQGGVCRR